MWVSYLDQVSQLMFTHNPITNVYTVGAVLGYVRATHRDLG